MDKLESIKKEINKIKELEGFISKVQDELIFCFIGSKTFLMIINMLDMVYTLLESAKEHKEKEVNRIERDIKSTEELPI